MRALFFSSIFFSIFQRRIAPSYRWYFDCVLLKKTPLPPSRAVVAPLEHGAFVLPVLTQPCHVNGAYLPEWNEDLVYNEPLPALLHPRALLLFELLDFGPRLDLDEVWGK